MWIENIDGDLINLSFVTKIHRVRRNNPDRDDYIEAYNVNGDKEVIGCDCAGLIDSAMEELKESLDALEREGK